MRHRRIRLGLLCGLAACNTAPLDQPIEVIWQERAWHDLEEAKRTAAAAVGEPRVVVFPGHGEITVGDWKLEGYPGNTYVRARFTYENTTGRQVDWVRVWLTVMDAEGVMVARQPTELFMPMDLPFNPGTLFADELRTPTLDVHRDRRGWQWALGCEAVFTDGEPAVTNYPAGAWSPPVRQTPPRSRLRRASICWTYRAARRSPAMISLARIMTSSNMSAFLADSR